MSPNKLSNHVLKASHRDLWQRCEETEMYHRIGLTSSPETFFPLHHRKLEHIAEATTSSNADNVRRVFGVSECKTLFIPTVVGDCKHHMNGVDLANQRRSTYTTPTYTTQLALPLLLA